MFKVKIFLIIAAVSTHPVASIACGNEYYYQPHDIPLTKNKLDLTSLLFFNSEHQTLAYWYHGFGDNVKVLRYELIKKINKNGAGIPDYSGVKWAQIQRAIDKKTDYKLLSDFAWYELRIGDKNNAVKLLEILYQSHPNDYNIVANLGTAYEVTGQNEKALAFLKKAVAINPQSHHGSEWIHVRILEQKIKAKPDYTKIIDLGADKNFAKWLKENAYDKDITPDSLMIQIAYQLHERISFVPEPDPIVGQLILDFADLTTIARSATLAKPFYKYAVMYDSSLLEKEKEKLLQAEGKMAEVLSESTDTRKATSKLWLYIMIVAAAVGLTALYFVSRMKVKV